MMIKVLLNVRVVDGLIATNSDGEEVFEDHLPRGNTQKEKSPSEDERSLLLYEYNQTLNTNVTPLL
jgi:hypothetical protein